jgi:hypothetical protein
MSNFDDGLKVLAYGNVSKLESTMNHHFLDQLKEVSDEITQTPKTMEELNDYVTQNHFTHIIIPDEHFHILNGSLKGCVVPVIELLGDHWIPWAIDRKKDYLVENGIEHVFVFSNRFLEPYGTVSSFYHVNTGFNLDFFYDKGLQKDIDILIHGSLGEDTTRDVYPVRNWLASVIPKIGEQYGLNVFYYKHPGYWHDSKNRPNKEFIEDYSDIINRSKIAIGGSSKWRLLLKKYYEVPSCGTVLIGDLPFDDSDFFKNNMIDIDPQKINEKDYEQCIARKILDVIDNYSVIKKKLQPFQSDSQRFARSYKGRALEMRSVLSNIF